MTNMKLTRNLITGMTVLILTLAPTFAIVKDDLGTIEKVAIENLDLNS